jgi:hypothetical protein
MKAKSQEEIKLQWWKQFDKTSEEAHARHRANDEMILGCEHCLKEALQKDASKRKNRT